ncbi:hypothetical protein PAHAL_9G102800 [Panicum hallii]|uniref:Uncharacterized protein n=1 Tax=Panicum hallii TaxID=206008 RepID=A0A2T8I0S2_9POAL|nr:hypothetical protein PAHAL_9G102800 [Panicum hallii]
MTRRVIWDRNRAWILRGKRGSKQWYLRQSSCWERGWSLVGCEDGRGCVVPARKPTESPRYCVNKLRRRPGSGTLERNGVFRLWMARRAGMTAAAAGGVGRVGRRRPEPGGYL